jgi:hypothetical protein
VPNQAIVHSFTVEYPAAEFTNFEFAYGPSHTAYLPTPSHPKFRVTQTDSGLHYELVVDKWAQAPAHVEISADRAYSANNCWWQLPSPLFAYDVTAVASDGGVVLTLDAAIATDDAAEAPGVFADASLGQDSAGASLDGGAIDAAIDGSVVD